jgi:hypothetical protein
VGFSDWAYVFRHNVVAGLLGIVVAGVPKFLINAYGLGESAAAFHAAGKTAVFGLSFSRTACSRSPRPA